MTITKCLVGSMMKTDAAFPLPAPFSGITVTVRLLSTSGMSIGYNRVVSSTNISTASFKTLAIVTLYPRMGTPSRVKGGLQEMRTVGESMVVTVRLWTAPNRPTCGKYH